MSDIPLSCASHLQLCLGFIQKYNHFRSETPSNNAIRNVNPVARTGFAPNILIIDQIAVDFFIYTPLEMVQVIKTIEKILRFSFFHFTEGNKALQL